MIINKKPWKRKHEEIININKQNNHDKNKHILD